MSQLKSNLYKSLAVAVIGLLVSGQTLADSQFTDRDGAPPDSFVASVPHKVSGLSGAASIRVESGTHTQVSVDGGPFTNDVVEIVDGQALSIRHVSSSEPNSSSTSMVRVGDLEVSFRSTTATFDRIPDPYSFGSKGDVSRDVLVESEAVTLSGYDTASPITVPANSIETEYRIDGGEWTDADGELAVDQSLQVRHRAGAGTGIETTSSISVGGIVGNFLTVTESAAPPVAVPESYSTEENRAVLIENSLEIILSEGTDAGVLANEVNENPTTALLVSDAVFGTLQLQDDGSFAYRPDDEFSGVDSFSYRVVDSVTDLQSETVTATITVRPLLNRYEMANYCYAIRANGSNKFVARTEAGNYAASSDSVDGAEKVYMKPSALGHYLLYVEQRSELAAPPPGFEEYGDVLSVSSPTPGSLLTELPLSQAGTGSDWTIIGIEDGTLYPNTPLYDLEPVLDDNEPNPNEPENPVWNLTDYREFESEPVNDINSSPFPFGLHPEFTLAARNAPEQSPTHLAVVADGSLALVPAGQDPLNESFTFIELDREDCNLFPEAQSDLAIEDQYPQGLPPSFTGNNSATGGVIGHADIHVHISSSTFLGGAQWGANHHPYGVTHAIGSCTEQHGADGERDPVGFFLGGGTEAEGPDDVKHSTVGYPYFVDWPARDMLTHEAIYWKWLERAWQGGLRLAVNEVVDNETLCELTRSQSEDQNADCNSQRNAKDQIGTMYAMQDYIDAQYGGRGEGFMRIVLDAAEARTVIEEGNLALVLGQEISNTVDCKPNYRSTTRDDSNAEVPGPTTVSYGCTMAEDPENPKSINNQLGRLWDLGIRKMISIHEFDTAFGGNGIFMDFLNVGTRENSGGQPNTDPNPGPFAPNTDTSGEESPTGEFWTTYDCPTEYAPDDPARVDSLYAEGRSPDRDYSSFSGYLWSGSGGEDLTSFAPPGCTYQGQGGRPGGPTACYPARRQCNARWMTPTGEYFYKKLMEYGFVFDFDHMEMGMKTQALELTEAQASIADGEAYPLVSSHGTFGGTTVNQAMRVLKNGGVMYPSIGRSGSFVNDLVETRKVYCAALLSRGDIAESDIQPDGNCTNIPMTAPLFGFGYGTDTNGLSGQSPSRGGSPANPVVYPFSLYDGAKWQTLKAEWDVTISPVVFDRPGNVDPNNKGRLGDGGGVLGAPGTAPDGNLRAWHEDLDGNAHYGMLSDIVQELALDQSVDHLRDMFNSAEAYLRAWEQSERVSAKIRSRAPASDGTRAVDSGGLLRPAPKPPEGELGQPSDVPNPADCGVEDFEAQDPSCQTPP